MNKELYQFLLIGNFSISIIIVALYYFFIYRSLEFRPSSFVFLALFFCWPILTIFWLIFEGTDFLLKFISLIRVLILLKNFEDNLIALIKYKDQYSQLINSDSVKNNPNELSNISSKLNKISYFIEFHTKKNLDYSKILDGKNYKWVKNKFNSEKLTTDIRSDYFLKTNKINRAISWVFDYKIFIYKNSSDGRYQINKNIADIEELLLDNPKVSSTIRDFGIKFSLGSGVVYRTRSPEEIQDWQSIFTNDFKKSIKQLDKNLQGRVFAAILEILESPMTVRGDTLKPLSADLKGAWRYRLGDYRLVYFPNSDGKKIVFLDIGARGGVYH